MLRSSLDMDRFGHRFEYARLEKRHRVTLFEKIRGGELQAPELKSSGAGAPSGQYRAMCHGINGKPGDLGDVESVSYRLHIPAKSSTPTSATKSSKAGQGSTISSCKTRYGVRDHRGKSDDAPRQARHYEAGNEESASYRSFKPGDFESHPRLPVESRNILRFQCGVSGPKETKRCSMSTGYSQSGG